MLARELLLVDPSPGNRPAMWIDRLTDGLLRVLTPLGPRYIRPTFKQRIYLLWIFRNFHVLPMQVLSARQRRLVDDLCARQNFVSSISMDGVEAPLLGTLERRPPIEEEQPPRRPSSSVSDVSPFAADAKQRP